MTAPSADLKALFHQLRLTIAAAESLTVGRVTTLLGSASGSSSFLLGGVTAYTIPQKVKLLGVDQAHAESVNAVSLRVATEMASGVCRMFNSSLGIGTTGYAEPSPGHGVAVPRAAVAIHLATDGGKTLVAEWVEGPGLGRVEMQQFVAEQAIALLEKKLRQEPDHDAHRS